MAAGSSAGDCATTFRPTSHATRPAFRGPTPLPAPAPTPAPTVTPQPSVSHRPTQEPTVSFAPTVGLDDDGVFGVPLPLLVAAGVGLVVACCVAAACVMCVLQNKPKAAGAPMRRASAAGRRASATGRRASAAPPPPPATGTSPMHAVVI